jgi:hypothetical protein
MKTSEILATTPSPLVPGGLGADAQEHARKVAVGKWIKAARLVSNEWIADHVKMGHASRVSRYCGRATDEDPRITQILRKLKETARSTT